jgi:alanine-synthesizing transaminase
VPSPAFSNRTRWPQQPNRLSLATDARARAGRHTIDLTVSNPTAAQLGHDPACLAPLAHPRGLDYAPESLGLSPAREAVAARYAAAGVPVTADRVVITASTSEAYAFLFQVLADHGDEVLTPAPSYPLFGFLADLSGVRLCPYPLRYDGSWHVDLAAVRAAITPRTRAILIVSPNNPTGSYLKRDEADALATLAAERGLALVSDEVFADYPLRDDPTRLVTLANEPRCLSFSLSGLSKVAALPQLKLGWMLASGPPSLVAEALARLSLVADTFLSTATPVQLALPELLATGNTMAAAIRARCAINLAHLRAALAPPCPAGVLDVEGGWYATVRVPGTRSEEDWALALLDQGVLVHPGHFFDFDREAYLVLSLLTPAAPFAEGVARLRDLVTREA